MDLNASSPSPATKAGRLSLSESGSDTEENEISEDDDDDRNHKHRKREAESQSMEGDSVEQVSTRPFRKRQKPFQNVHYYPESDSRQKETWKRYNGFPPEKDFSSNFVNKRPDLLRAPMDLNQMTWANQLSSGEPISGRGRAREFGSWGQRDSRFNSVDIALQMVQQGSVPPSLFAGRGMPNVSNAHTASWNGFGFIPGMPNNDLATHHSLGLQGNLRPAINPSLSIGIPRQRCRDFEERGFCLRGDMCTMEHGVNRIVVEDVQSLSQFNLPGSLPSVHLLGAPTGPGSLSSVGGSSSSLSNIKGLHGKTSKPGMDNDGMGFNDTFSGSAGMAGADVYDPDQPLWTNNRPETSGAVPALNPSKIEKIEPSLCADLSDRQVTVFEGFKNRTETKEKHYCTKNTSNDVEDEENDHEPLKSLLPPLDSYPKVQNETARNFRKPSLLPKALRSLFVNGIPQMSNKREALLLHFQKFGEVIDIYTPLNSERAFVQFSKREEAEAALTSPEAVMGNRFIKLSWANRDNIPQDVMNGKKVDSVTPHLSTLNKGKDNLQSTAQKVSIVPSSVASVHASDLPKPVAFSGAQVPPPSQKKLESLELLKEELRKKQELLDRKRNEFRRQLDKLEKQATGLKSEAVSEHAAKIHKDMSTANGIVASPQSKLMANKNKPAEIVVHHSPRANSSSALPDSSGSKPSIRPLAPLGAPSFMNRFKLDNRPTAFKIMPPLPTGIANLAALKEHFSVYGDLSEVKLEEDLESNDSQPKEKHCAARIAFKTRSSAERAYINGKSWQGNDLRFTWLASNSSRNESGGLREPDSKLAGVVEARNSEKNGDGKHVDRDEDLRSRSSEEEQSLEVEGGDAC